jgi:predicted NUDIX family NTP pyrophosphohydrolase
MPFESEAQRKAMYAAASGKSNIGIPEKVAKKFIKHAADGNELDNHWLEQVLLAEMIKGDEIPDEPTLLSTPEFKEDSEAWQTKEGKNKNGGLNEKGRKSYNKAHGAHLKAPQPEGGPRKESFCARMKGMKAKLTNPETARDPESRINKSLRKWKCDTDLPNEVKRLELQHLKDQLGSIATAIQSIKKDAEEQTEAPEIPGASEHIEVRLGKQSENDAGTNEASMIDADDGGTHEASTFVTDEKKEGDPCWKGYEQLGTKEKDGKEVPNCVPVADAHAEPIAAEPLIVMPIAHDGPLGRAAGIMFLTKDNDVLLIRRGMGGGDFPGTWAVPGGHQKGDETLEDAARRECAEETGIKYDGKLEVLHDDGQFCTYVARDVEKSEVKLNYESTGYDWCHTGSPSMPLHPGLDIAFKIAGARTEYDYAKLISQDCLPSPQMYANVMLLAIRITGTGLAYRSSIGEHVWRDPSLYLNEEFLKRCNGLIVVMDHPDSAVLTSEEFKNRAVGSIILPYIKGDEVWGIAKIYDQASVDEILEGEISTSPSVVFDNTAGNTTLTTENGEPLLIEGVPFLLDHIAIVTKARGSKGVWDKGGEATGVLLTNPEVSEND